MNKMRSGRKTKREKKRARKKIILTTISLLIIIGSFFFIMNNRYLAIKEINFEGQKTIIESDLRQQIKGYLAQYWLGIIPHDNVLFFSKKAIRKLLIDAFPKIQDIDIDLKNGDELVIHLGERSAQSLWCYDREYTSKFDEECYFVDKEGMVFARAPYFSGNVYMKFFVHEPDTLEIGKKVSVLSESKAFFDFLDTLEQKYQMNIASVHFKEFGDVAIDLNRIGTIVYQGQQPIILYNQSDDYTSILRNIGVAINFDDFNDAFKTQPKDLESIDVRFEGRVLYSF